MDNGVIMENGVTVMLTATEERRPAPKPAATLHLLILVTTVWEMLTIHNLVTKTLVQVKIKDVMLLLTCWWPDLVTQLSDHYHFMSNNI